MPNCQREPTSENGKAISSQNRRTHGLTGNFQIMLWENADEYVAMREELHAHYSPAGIIEIGYVDRLAEHTWLRYRSLNLQTDCFDDDQTGLIHDEKQFALLLRYQNQNERGIDKCVNQLLKLQTARRKEQNGFVSEIRKERKGHGCAPPINTGASQSLGGALDTVPVLRDLDAAETRKKEAHEARIRLINAHAQHLETDSDIRETLKAPMPGHTRIPFEELSRHSAAQFIK